MPGGRQHPAFRSDAPDHVPIAGGNLAVHYQHQQDINETEDNRRKPKTKKQHRNRLKAIIEWLQTHYPEYATGAGGVVEISAATCNNPNFFQHTNTMDLYYEGINVTFIKAFLGSVKRKENGKMCSFSHIRKFHDAILFGAEQAGHILPRMYHQEMQKFLESFKKESVKARREGNVDEQDADPIPFPLYELTCRWSVEAGNMFAWAYTVFLWHCMGRSASVDPLGIHNFARGMDALRITYDDSKADGAGDRVSPKNVYANPLNPSICPMTALGIWMMLRNETFIANRDGIFLENGTLGTASHRYCRQLGELFMDHRDEVSQFCRPERAKSHGFRKGSATHATSGTTNPPPLPSVSKRGEWSQGGVFDKYFLFAEPGDQYLGRCLTGLPQNDVNFSLLPPHFPCGIENDSVHAGLRLCFGNIMDLFQDCNAGLVGVLLLLLGSVVYHFESFVKPIIANDPSHPFSGLTLL